jgi:DNA-binding transcriptional LysR family regulator
MTTERWPDLAVLELLVAVRDHGSIGAAANAVGMTQPNASRALARYERRTGLPLLVRSTRGTGLTDEAVLIVDWARDLLESATKMSAGITALRGTHTTRLRVAASLTVAEYLLPAWLAGYRALPDAAAVELTVANSEQVTAAVLDRSVDLGFVEAARISAGVRSRRVGTDHLVVVVAPGHRWARRRRPLAAAELARTALLVREPGSGTRDALERACSRAGLTMAEPEQEHQSNASVRIAAMAGVAPAVLSEHAVREGLVSGRLVSVPVDDLDLTRPLRAIWRSGTRPSDATGRLLAVCLGGP